LLTPLPHPLCFWPAALSPCRTRSSSYSGPSTLRSTSARRCRRGVSPARGPCLVAPPLGPRGPSSDPRSPLLDHRGGGRLRSAPQARGSTAGVLPGARPAPRRFASRAPWARLGSPNPSPQSPRRSMCARAGRARRYVRRHSVVTTSGGTCAPPPVTTPQVGGDGGGTGSSPGKRRVGPVQMGTEWDVVLCSHCSGCASGATLQSQ
jgi:hypothetical protein